MVINAAPQEGIGQIPLGITGEHHQGAQLWLGLQPQIPQFRDAEVEIFQLVEHIIGEIARGFVQLIEQHHRALRRAAMGQASERGGQICGRMAIENRLAQCLDRQVLTRRDVLGLEAGLDVLIALQGVVVIKEAAGGAGGFHLVNQRFAEAEFPGQGMGKARFAGAGFAGEQQGLAEQQGHIAGIPQAVVHQVATRFAQGGVEGRGQLGSQLGVLAAIAVKKLKGAAHGFTVCSSSVCRKAPSCSIGMCSSPCAASRR